MGNLGKKLNFSLDSTRPLMSPLYVSVFLSINDPELPHGNEVTAPTQKWKIFKETWRKGETGRLLSYLLRDLEAQTLTLSDDSAIGHLWKVEVTI